MADSVYEQLRPDLPEPLRDLRELALDLRWSWSHVADDLWRAVDEKLWRQTRNPWLILQTVSQAHLRELAGDKQFTTMMRMLRREQLAARETAGWLEPSEADGVNPRIAFFSMEYGITEALPLYSGGLGVLAGDFLKSCSESGVQAVGVGLLYQQGYFRQGLDVHGRQLAFYPYNDPTQLPIQPARDPEGEWLGVEVDLPGRKLHLRLWKAQIGRIGLYLLDSNTPLNTPADRGITAELYGGSAELRLQQEIVLGIGGFRALAALGFEPDVCHLNEGHAGFVALERARHAMLAHNIAFEVALTATRAGNLFTTHTPVKAGFDSFEPTLFCRYMHGYAAQLGIGCQTLQQLGKLTDAPDEPFQMALLAMRGCNAVNGVSRLHGQVSREIFLPLFPRWPKREVPVGHVTNGVHMPTWDSEEADRLWTRYCGKNRWREQRDDLEAIVGEISDRDLWGMRTRNRQTLIEWLRGRMTCQSSLGYLPGASQPSALDSLLDPNILTLGFGRRFASYKRPNMLLQDRDRLARLLTDPARPAQLIIAGKAHPQDETGKDMIQQWIRFISDYELGQHILYVVDYDLLVAKQMVMGVDVWINTPRRPWEACGTSGMKVLVNGGLNLSELDGWWAEAYSAELGWALGDGLEHDHDEAWDRYEAGELYDLLEQQVIPEFYRRDEQGVPVDWVARIRRSMARLTPWFSSNRMLESYYRQYYLPLARNFRQRNHNGAALAKAIHAWRQRIEAHWTSIHIGKVDCQSVDNRHRFDVQVYLDDLEPGDVQVQLYADEQAGEPAFCQAMELVETLTGAVHGYRYALEIDADRDFNDFTVRIVPHHPGVAIPLESQKILWQR